MNIENIWKTYCKMEFVKTAISNLYLIKPLINDDERGSFMETYHIEKFKSEGINYNYKQDNLVNSKKNVLRGLHYQKNKPQAKLIKCIRGEIFDVVVDMRKTSSSFGYWHGEILSEDNHHQLFVPEGFAHGYYVISEFASVSYKCSEVYDCKDEGGIIWNDSKLKIKWPCIKPILSKKDQNWPSFN